MKELIQRLRDLGPTIAKICEVSGAAGASIGVVHSGQTIHTANFGYRDVAHKLVADEHTNYHIASLTKSFTATAVATLVSQGRLSWDQPIHAALPNFTHEDANFTKAVTLLDFLAHRTGLASKNSLWVQDADVLLLKPHDLLPTVSYLEVVHPLRSAWLYNNFGYNLVAAMVEQIESRSWGAVLADKIFAPLGLSRTTTGDISTMENAAQGYMALANGKLLPVGSPCIADGTIMQGANGVKSNVRDLLLYYQATLQAWKHQMHHSTVMQDDTLPLGDVNTLLTPHILIDTEDKSAGSYGAGWVLVDLPAPLGAIGTNGMFLPAMPLVGKGSTKKRVWYHNGSLVGFFSSVHVLPDTETIIVVLVNSIAKNDCADWIGQLLLEAILDNPQKNDYFELAKTSAAAYGPMWAHLKDDLDKSKTPNRTSRPLSAYTGRYYNRPRNWFIEVRLKDEALKFTFQGLESQEHLLHHHDMDKFSWPLSERDSALLWRWPDLDADMYVFDFQHDEAGQIDGLRWIHDSDVPEGEVFFRVFEHTSAQDLNGSLRSEYDFSHILVADLLIMLLTDCDQDVWQTRELQKST